MQTIFNFVSRCKNSPVFNFVAGCTGSAFLGAGTIMLFPHMSVLATFMGLGSFLLFEESMNRLLRERYPHTLPPEERLPEDRMKSFKP